jgi:hypothetical protein
VRFSNDTVINQTGYDAFYNEIATFHAHDDLASSPNAFDGLTSRDCSGKAANDGSGDVTWTPAWRNTTWTPKQRRALEPTAGQLQQAGPGSPAHSGTRDDRAVGRRIEARA